MEAKLAEYRARKKAQLETEEKRNKLWSLLTLRFLRRKSDSSLHSDSGEEEPIIENVPWTKIDYAILAVKILMWIIGQVVFVKIGFGAVYFATSAFALIWLNLGTNRRKPGEMSAYSVFNPGCKSIDGTLTAEQFEAEIRHRKM